jgi:hypothetical protein
VLNRACRCVIRQRHQYRTLNAFARNAMISPGHLKE